MNKKLFLVIIGLVMLGLGAAGLWVWNTVHGPKVAQAAPDTHEVRYKVVGSSMDPTYKDGDWLTVRTDVKEIKRGDVIVFRLPEDESKVLCRRVIGVVNDAVGVKYYPNVKITTTTSKDLSQAIILPSNIAAKGDLYDEKSTTVQEGSVFVGGDNSVPGGSYDSNEWGLLPLGNVVGVVTGRAAGGS